MDQPRKAENISWLLRCYFRICDLKVGEMWPDQNVLYYQYFKDFRSAIRFHLQGINGPTRPPGPATSRPFHSAGQLLQAFMKRIGYFARFCQTRLEKIILLFVYRCICSHLVLCPIARQSIYQKQRCQRHWKLEDAFWFAAVKAKVLNTPMKQDEGHLHERLDVM